LVQPYSQKVGANFWVLLHIGGSPTNKEIFQAGRVRRLQKNQISKYFWESL